MSPTKVAVAVLATVLAATFASVANAQSLPEGWFASGDAPKEYKMMRSTDARYRGEYGASVVHESGSGQSFGTLMQAVQAAGFRGKRVSLKGWLRTENAGSAQMWLRVDDADRIVSMDNMDDRPVKGTTPWTEYEIVMDVPNSANHLAFGVFLSGKGALAIDEVRLSVAPENARLTKFYDYTKEAPDGIFKSMKRVSEAPTNLNFEK
jgi:hypothetical protein